MSCTKKLPQTPAAQALGSSEGGIVQLFVLFQKQKLNFMEITYRLSETEFDQNVFESIKKVFKNRLIKISIVAEETTEIASVKAHHYAVSIPYDELSKIADAFEEDDSFDVMGELNKFKTLDL